MSDFIDCKDDDEVDEEAEAEARYGFSFTDPVPADEPQTEQEIPRISIYGPDEDDGEPPKELDLEGFRDVFSAKPAAEWIEEAAKLPVQRPLFDEFWYERELAILFADTGRGKSILATQIAESIASGVSVQPFAMGSEAQRVLLFDFRRLARGFVRQGLCSNYCIICITYVT